MSPLSWIKNLIKTFFGEGKKKELNAVAKTMLDPTLPVDFKLDESWQRLRTRTRAFADEYWKVEHTTDCQPVWYLRNNDLRAAPLTLLYTTADGLSSEAGDVESNAVVTFLIKKLTDKGWRQTDKRTVESGAQILFSQSDDLRVVETKRRGNGTWLVGVYIPEAARPEGVDVDESELEEAPA